MSPLIARWFMVILLVFSGGLFGYGLTVGPWALALTVPALVFTVASFLIVWWDIESLTVTVR